MDKLVLIRLSVIIASVLYLPLVISILLGKIKQSFATWLLWVSLDVIALVSTLVLVGNWELLAIYCIGGSVVALCLFCKKQRSWSIFETKILVGVIICCIGWAMSGPRMATVLSTLAVVISGLPQIRESWNTPNWITAVIYFGYVCANGLSFLGGKDWSIQERFYPGSCVILCGVITLASLHRKPKVPIVQTEFAPLS